MVLAPKLVVSLNSLSEVCTLQLPLLQSFFFLMHCIFLSARLTPPFCINFSVSSACPSSSFSPPKVFQSDIRYTSPPQKLFLIAFCQLWPIRDYEIQHVSASPPELENVTSVIYLQPKRKRLYLCKGPKKQGWHQMFHS